VIQFYRFIIVAQLRIASTVLFAVYLNDLFDHRDINMSSFIFLFADNIILLTHSVSQLQLILTRCERELS